MTAPAPELPARLTDEPMVVVSARMSTSAYLRIRDEAAARSVIVLDHHRHVHVAPPVFDAPGTRSVSRASLR